MKRLILALCLVGLLAPAAHAADRDLESTLESARTEAIGWLDSWLTSLTDLVWGSTPAIDTAESDAGYPGDGTRKGGNAEPGSHGQDTGPGHGPGSDDSPPVPELGPVLVPSG